MFEERKVYAIIGAAGSGKRMAAPLPKQFLKLGNKTILENTVEKFNKSSYIDEVIIVTAEDYMDLCCQFFHDQKRKPVIVSGGAERQDSIYSGLSAIENPAADDIVLIHDGARPFASPQLIDKVVEKVATSKAAIAAVPTKDTIRDIEKGTLDRSKLYNVQTPQGFRYILIKEAFDRAFEEGFYGTDDASLVERLGYPIEIVIGEEANIKITTKEDLPMETRIGSGYDVHKLTEDRKLILGGVLIPYEKGLLGHSDADVLIHALMDAILGSMALGDIGKHFPDTDPKYKGISSVKLLEHVGELMRNEGYSLGNADVTVICQKPKLAGYIDDMRENVAKALQVDVGRVSIKATTTEKLGFTGRGEGIAAEAVCLLNRN